MMIPVCKKKKEKKKKGEKDEKKINERQWYLRCKNFIELFTLR